MKFRLGPNLADLQTDSSQLRPRFRAKQRPTSGGLKCTARELKHRRCLLKMTHKQVGRWRRNRGARARAAPRDPPGLNLSPARNLKQHL